MNIYEVQGDKIEKLDINLVVSSRVNDYMMVGLTFGGEGSNSLVAIPYDFKNLVTWNNIIWYIKELIILTSQSYLINEYMYLLNMKLDTTPIAPVIKPNVTEAKNT